MRMFEELASARERGPGDMVDEVLLILDTGEGRLTYVSQEASAFFAIPPNLLTGSTAVSLIPELESLVSRDFETRIATAQGPRDVSVCVRALAGATPAVMVTLRSIASNRAIASRGARLESLWTLVVRRGLGGADYVRAILHEALVGIGLEHASLARVDGDALEVEERDSGPALASRIAIDRTVAGAAVLRSGTFAVLDTADSTEFIALADGLRCVLASAFRVGDERYVLTFGSTIPRTEPFGLDDWRYVDTVVEALSRGIERRESDARIQRLAYVDALTGLPNRGALHARLDEALAESERLGARTAVLFLDIDGFKAVNDTVGHRGGDTVLAEVAQRLRGTLRREEYIGRLGGDEFAIVMPHIADRHEISSIAQRIGGVLTFPFCVDAYRFSLSASIGVAIYPDDAANRDELLACADAAMYSAKGDGGARIRFGGAESDPAIAIASANASASFAGETRDVGYILCYQPILDIAAGRVLAAEALIRRIHPVHGLLAPERGWSIAEDDGGRRALDRWVLREATMQARMWSLAGSPIRIDVNLAAFDQRDIDVLLADETLASDVRRLRIEIVPEQFADAERRDQLPAFVDHCARNGIGLVLDGFDGSLGTLSSLAHLPIDAVKLERSLVESIGGSGTARAVIEGTVIVAKSLGWSVIAKGVETAAQQEALIALGCDAIQGFFVAHPMTAMDFGTWLRDRHAIGRQA